MSIAEKLTTIAENEQKVYEAGKQAQYDLFWDAFQDNGNRTDYQVVFNGKYWTNETFKPKYSMHFVGSGAYQLFQNSTLTLDLAELEEELGIVFDFSQSTSLTYMLMFTSGITGLNVLNTSSMTDLRYVLGYAYGLKRIKKLILKDDGSQGFTGTFLNASGLEEITTIEGVFGNTLSFADSSKLNKATITLVINKLSDTATGMTVSFNKTAITNAFGSTENAEWLALVASKPNWTFSV